MSKSKLSLKDCKKLINNLPNGLTLKSELTLIHRDTKKLIKDSKKLYASKDYYIPKINWGFNILRTTLAKK